MTITRIGPSNHESFAPFLFKASDFTSGNVLKLGAIENDTACGAIAFQIIGDTAEILSIYVANEFRRRGVAAAVLRAFEDLCVGTEVKTIISNSLPTNNGLEDFLAASGFVIISGSPVYSFNFADIQKSETLQKYLSRGDYSRSSACVDLPPFQQRELRDYLMRHNFSVPDMLAMKFSPTLSSVSLDARGKIDSCLLCSNFGNSVGIDILLSDSACADAVLVLFRRLFETLSIQKLDGIQLFYLAANKKITPFAKALLGDCVHLRTSGVCAVKCL